MFSRNKYHNIKTEVNGIKFDSKKEAKYYLELKMLEKIGLIKNLQLQVKFQIVPKEGKNPRARFYVADFVYYDCEKKQDIVVDVKSPITRKNPVYSLKKALFLSQYYDKYEFTEI